jgi:hypothetical protein
MQSVCPDQEEFLEVLASIPDKWHWLLQIHILTGWLSIPQFWVSQTIIPFGSCVCCVILSEAIISVDNHIRLSAQCWLHKLLKWYLTAKESHWAYDPFKLPQSRHSEFWQILWVLFKLHVPKSGCEIQCGKNGGYWASNVTNTLVDYRADMQRSKFNLEVQTCSCFSQ